MVRSEVFGGFAELIAIGLVTYVELIIRLFQ